MGNKSSNTSSGGLDRRGTKVKKGSSSGSKNTLKPPSAVPPGKYNDLEYRQEPPSSTELQPSTIGKIA
jgi:hypothetical protein